MIERIIAFSVQQRFLILALGALLVFVGLYSSAQLPIDAFPDVTNIQVQVNTDAPALSPIEVEKLITFPIELSMSGLPKLRGTRSLSKFGLSQVTVVFEDDVDIYFARQLVNERLQVAREQIPMNLGQPVMGPISTALGEIYQYVVEGEGRSQMELRTIQDWLVKTQLRTVPGVTEINSFGGFVKQYQVLIDPAKLVSYNLTVRQVFETLENNNANAGGAYIEDSAEQYVIRGVGLVQKAEDIENIVIASEAGIPIYVRNVAEVVEGPEIRQGAVTKDGKGEVVTGIVMMLKDENSRAVVERTKKKVEEVQKSLPSGVRLVPFYDMTDLVDKTILTVQTNLFEGGVLVILVLFLMLGNFRAALIVASIIPLSMVFGMTGMVRSKLSGNLMSLGAIDFGLIVDGSIVMVENVVRQLSEGRKEIRKELTRAQVIDIVSRATREVGRPVFFFVSIIIIVFLPIITLQDMEGKMFKPMAYTVIMVLGGALILTLTLVPVLCSLTLSGNVSEKENRIMLWLKQCYAGVLRKALDRPLLTVLIAVLISSPGFWMFSRLGSEFVPELDEGSIMLHAWKLPSISLSESINSTTKIEQILMRFPEVETVVSKIGRAEIATDVMGVEVNDILVMLKPYPEWSDTESKAELIENMSRELSEVPGIVFSFLQPIEMRVSELIAGVRSDVAIKIFGPDLDVLKEIGAEIQGVIRQVRGAADVKAEQISGLPVLQIEIKRNIIARHGINVSDVLEIVETAIGGKVAGQVLEGERRFDLVLRYEESSRRNVGAIRNILVSAPGGSKVPLSRLADIYVEEGPAQISREQGQRRIVVEVNVRGRDIGSFVQEAQNSIDQKVTLPAGYSLQWGGQFENMQRAINRLKIVVPLTLLLIFILLFSTFNSASQGLLVFTGVPLAISGGVLALYFRGIHFSISAGVGFIALSAYRF